MKKRIVCLFLAAFMLFSTLSLVSCGEKREGYTMMTVDINPSVEFMVDGENKVVSVTALNDDGSVLIAGEAFIGKSAEEAVELVISLASETGYLVGGNAEADANNVRISVSGNTAYAEQLREQVEGAAEQMLASLDISGIVTRVEQLSSEALRDMAVRVALISEEQAAEMTDEQLYGLIAESRIETAVLLTEQMRDAYYFAKEYQLSFAEKEATAQIIEQMGSLYTLVASAYSNALDAYSAAIAAIEEFRYENFTSPESDYQLALAQLRDAKSELLSQKNYVATLEINGTEYVSASATLQLKENNYNSLLAAFEMLGATIDQSLEVLVQTLRQCEAALRTIEEGFSSDITAALQSGAVELEAALNEAKASFFLEFENAHAEDIAAIEQALIDQKNELKSNNAAQAE